MNFRGPQALVDNLPNLSRLAVDYQIFSPTLFALAGSHPGQFTNKLLGRNMRFMLLGHAGLVVFDSPCQLLPRVFPRLLNVDAMFMFPATAEHKGDASGSFMPFDVVNSDFVVHSSFSP
jgi:hypothetical protein